MVLFISLLQFPVRMSEESQNESSAGVWKAHYENDLVEYIYFTEMTSKAEAC